MVAIVYRYPARIFDPAMKIISSITNANQAIVTTSSDHNYVDNMIIRIVVASGYGMPEINRLMGLITVIDATSFSIAIDTVNFTPFSVPLSPLQTSQAVPVGDQNADGTGYVYNALPWTP